MAGSPKFKVYDNDGEYVASCKTAEDAAILVTIGYPDRGTVRLGHGRILFTAGVDGDSSSYDACADIILKREAEVHEAAFARRYPDLAARLASVREDGR